MDLANLDFNYLVSNGIFCLLFVYMLWNNMTTTKSREQGYMDTINKFSEAFDKLADKIDEMKKG